MATLKLSDYNFSGIDNKEETLSPTNINTPVDNPESLDLTPQEPYVVSSSDAPEPEEQFNFSGLLQVKKPGRSNAVSSNYGIRKDPLGKGTEFHDGLDIPLELNTPLKPFGNGEVFFAGNRKGYGKSVGIDYGNGIKVYLNHLNKTEVEIGDKVTADAIIGLSGNTGRSTGPHTHIQALKDGVSIDPRKIFNENPDKVGLALTIKGLIEDNNVIAESSEDNFDYSGLTTEEPQTSLTPQAQEDKIDFSGIAPTTENGEVDTDVIKFNPAEKQKGLNYGQLLLNTVAPENAHIKEMAQGIESLEKFRFKPRTVNPNALGKAISFNLNGDNGEPPTLNKINEELAKILNLTQLNNKFKNDKDFSTGLGTPLISIPNPDVKKLSDGTWQVNVPYGMSSGGVELINAYARGGAKAFSAKRKEIEERSKVYQEDLDKQKADYDKLAVFRKQHPYINLLLDPGRPIIHGALDTITAELQLMHSSTMLTKALWTSNVYGLHSDEYANLIKEDAIAQTQINKAIEANPKEEILLAQVPRNITSAFGALPRFMAAGSAGGWALPTLTYIENLHRGNSEAIRAALPMALMVGGMHGLDKFIAEGGNPLDVFKKSEIANNDFITSISSDSPGNQFYLAAQTDKIPLKVIDFKAITPLQRQLVMRGTNALVNVGTSLITNPQIDRNSLFEQAIVGLALPVGKGVEREATRFQQRSILNGDAYTLSDGSILLRAPIDEASGLIGGRIPQFKTPYVPSTIEEEVNYPSPIGTLKSGIKRTPDLITRRNSLSNKVDTVPVPVDEHIVSRIPTERQLRTTNVDLPGKRSTVIPIDQAALNLLDLRRAYETGSYLQNAAPQTTGKVGKFNVVVDQRKQDILSAIKILDEAIPKETQEYFKQNEALIREAIKTNYEDRIQKEEFVLGHKIIRKPADKLTMEDVRPYNPKESTSKDKSNRSSLDNFMQTTRRSMISVEEAGKKGLEANQKNKGTFNTGIDVSDIPYFVQIAIGKLGRKGLDAAEFVREMVAEHGDDFFPIGMEVYKQARSFVDGVYNLANAASNDFGIKFNKVDNGKFKTPPFPVADLGTIKNIFYVGSKYLTEAKEQDIPLAKVVATQKAVRTDRLIKFGEEPNLAILEGKIDLAGNIEAPKAVKIEDNYYLFDGHHRSSSEKLKGNSTIRGRVIDFNEIANGNIQSRAERARETFDEIGRENKWFIQEKQLEVREDFLKPPTSTQFNEGFTIAPKWIADNSSKLVQMVGFHVEDFYRRGIEPKLTEIIGRLRTELGDWIDNVSEKDWNNIFESAKKYYETNNADPFFSGMKQHVLETLPIRFNGQMFLDIYNKPVEGVIRKGVNKGQKIYDENKFFNEVEWTSGLLDFVNDKINKKEKISKDELLDVIEKGQVKVDEVVLGQVTELPNNYKIIKSEKNPAYNYPYEVLNEKDEIFGAGNTESEARLDALKELNTKPTKYDLKTYGGNEKLELEGGENPKEVLLRVPHKPGVPTLGFAAFLDSKFGYNVEEFKSLSRFDQKNLEKAYRASNNSEDLYIENSNPEIYQTDHWQQGNVVAHFRANERETIDGLKVFHSEEFQSDWNQAGRKEGYKQNKEYRYEVITNNSETLQGKFKTEKEALNFINEDTKNEGRQRLRLIDTNLEVSENAVPKNPFMENNWKELAFKRFLRMGIEMGKDGVSWTTARQQQERYGKTLEGKVLSWELNDKGNYDLSLSTEDGRIINNDSRLKNLDKEGIAKLTSEDIANQIEQKTNQHIKDSDKVAFVRKGQISYSVVDENGITYSERGGMYANFDTLEEAKAFANYKNFREEQNLDLDKSINFSNKYSDYDTYFVNLAKKIGKKFEAEYKVKNIETSSTEQNRYEVYEDFENDGYGIYDNSLESNIPFNFSEIPRTREDAQSYIDNNLKTEKIEQIHYLEITPQMRDSILKEGQPLYGLSSTEQLKASAPIGTRNRILTRDIFDSTKNEILKSIQEITNDENGVGTVLNSGLNPDAFLDQARLLYKGWNDFTEFSSSLTRKYGDKITPHLENIWNWIKESASAFNQDERGFFNFGKKKRLYKGEELELFNDNRSSRLRSISMKAHRGIALAQTYEAYGEVYNTLRGLQRTSNAYSTTILEQLSRSVSLLKKDIDQKVAQAIFTRNKEAINNSAEDATIIAKFGLTPEQTRAYHYIRSAVSNVLDLRRDQTLYREHQAVTHINDQLTNLGLPTGGTPINVQHADLLTKLVDVHTKIQSIEDYYKELKDSGYISLQRLGRYRAELENPSISATKVVGGKTVRNPDRYLVDYADSPEEAQRRINEWKEQLAITNNGKISDAHNPADFREVSRKLTPGEFEELVSGAGVRNTKEIDSLRAEVYERYPTMGYQLRRELYPGYRENNEFMIKSIAHQAEVYASSYYNNLGRQEGLRTLENTGIEHSDRDLWNVARQFIEDETSTPQYNNVDKVAFKARKFTYLMQLGYQVKQLYLNAFIQPVTQNYNYLARVENPTTEKRLGGLVEVEKIFIKGTKLSLQLAKAAGEDLIGIKKIRSSEFTEFRDIYNQLKNERVIEPEYTKSLLELEAEHASEVDSKFQSRIRRFVSAKQHEHWAGGFMRAGELTTRTQMAASLFYAGKRFGLAGDGLADFIVQGIDATQTNPSRAENPYYVRKAGEVGKLFYQFGAFRHMWWENLALNLKSDWKHKSAAATSRTIAPLAMMAGISGLPLSGFAYSLYGLTTGKNPDERLKRWMRYKIADNDYLESLALYGFTGSAGFSQSAGIQAPIVDTLTEQLTEDSWWDKLFSNNIPALLTAKQIGQGLSGVAAAAYDGDIKDIITGLVQAAPIPGNRPLRDVNKAINAYNHGYKTNAGDIILSKSKTTGLKVFGQTLGITPNEITEFYEDKRYKKLKDSELGKASRKIYRKLKRTL